MRKTYSAIVMGLSMLTAGTIAAIPAAQAATEEEAPWPEAYFEIFRLAPGAHEEFVRLIARDDQVSAAAGLPPTQLFFHQDGADWDVLLFKPVNTTKPTAEQEAAMDAKRKELQLPSGPAYYVNIRRLISSHTDTKAYGPISAEQWLAKLDGWRKEHPKAAK
ncbi:MAG: hypothetical protein AB7E24_07940 [Novosphingobium sp.]